MTEGFPSDLELLIKIRAGWRLQRIFTWAQVKYPVAGDSLLLSAILRNSKQTKTRFSDAELKRTLALCEERFTKETITWLRAQGGME